MFNKNFFTLIGIVCLMIGSPALAQSKTCDLGVDYASRAQEQFESEAYVEAMTSYSCILQAASQNDVAHIGRLQTAVLAGDYLTAYSEAFWLDDSAPGIIGEAIVSLTDQIITEPNTAHLYEIRAFLYIFSRQSQSALQDADHLLEIESDNAFAYLIQAAAYELSEDVGNSAATFEYAVELALDNPQFYGLMAAVQFATFNVPAMAENSIRAIELMPNLAEAYRLRGLAHLFMGDAEAGLADANQAIELDPSNYTFYTLRANTYRALGDPQVALADLNTAIELNPRTSIGYALRSGVQAQLGELEAAAQDFATWINVGTVETITGESLILAESVTVTMTKDRAYYLPFEGQAGQVINMSATSIEAEAVDPLLLLISPDGTPLVFNDDMSDESLNAEVLGYELPQTGIYTLVISHANGGSEGEIVILLTLD